MQSSRHPECIPTTVGPRHAVRARRIYAVATCWPSRMVVVREVHAAWKSAHTLCNVCAGFHVTYVHEIGVEKNIDTMHHLYVFVSQRGKEGGGGEKRLVFVSKKVSVFTDDP